MIKSMTGFARCESRTPRGTVSWELRTVNHRYLEVGLRLPEEFRALEAAFRERIAARVKRGKLDGVLRFQPATASGGRLALNEDLVRLLLEANERIERMMENPARGSSIDILRWPGVLESAASDPSEIQQEATALLDACLAELGEGRRREGAQLQALIEQRCAALRDEVERIRAELPEIAAAQRERLHARLEELRAGVDAARLEQELALLAQRMDIGEELDRLEVHIEEVGRVLGQDEPVGRRLDFLMQELNREANTVGSKSAAAATTRASVEMKVIVEQMREQVQNIE